MVEKAIQLQRRFIYLRRFKEEITNEKIEKYFEDVDISKLTNNEYNTITVYRKKIYLAKINEDLQIKRGVHIGYAIALSIEQNYAGGSFLDVDDIIFEEFMSRSAYLKNECNKLMNLYATVDRKRGTTRLWLVGNSISRVCPYIYEWNLSKIFSEIKQGEIRQLELSDYLTADNKPVKLAIEYCLSTGVSSGTIGTNAGMINSGAWESHPQPHLPISKKLYRTLYKIGFQYQNFQFLAELLVDSKKNMCWFVYPYYKDWSKNILVFSDIVKIEKNWQRNIYDVTIKNRKIQNLLNTFRESNIFYCSDLVGTDFKQVIDFQIRK